MSNLNLFDLIPKIRYTVELPVSKKEIEVEPYKHGNVRSILLLMQDFKQRKQGHMKKALQSMQKIVEDCILPDAKGDKIDVKKLHIADFVYVMNYIKAISNGEESSFFFRCDTENCKQEKKIDFVLDDCEVKNLENKDIDKIEIEFENQDNIFLHLKPFTFQIYIDNARFFGQEFIEGNEATRYYASFIDAIEGKGQIFDNMKKDNIVKFLDALYECDLKKLIDYINNVPMLVWEKKYECEKCGKINHIKLEHPTDFFV